MKPYKIYTLDGILIEEIDMYWYSQTFINNFSGILEYIGINNTWWHNGDLSRVDGPAVEYCNGTKEYFLNGIGCTQEQHALLVDIMKLKGLI